MAKLLTPTVLRRGFEIFVLVSLASYLVLLFYGNDTSAFLSAIPHIRWGWVAIGAGLASMDWFGGGLRNWILARNIMPNPSFKGMVLAGGMGAWASYMTPLQAGNAPMMIYTMKRYGVPVPVGLTVALMSFISTIAFFAIAGPLAIAFGAGKSLGEHGVVLGISLYDLFVASLTAFFVLGVVLLTVMLFPRFIRDLIHRIATALGRRSRRVAARFETLERGLDQAHESVARFNSVRGWLSLGLATIVSGPSHANKLLAGYVALRAIGIEAHFVDVLLLQTFITFLLYFAPTPGGSGIAELISAAVMSIYVPRGLTPLYTLLWRMVLSYYTIAFGGVVFSSWVRRGLKGIEQDPAAV